MGNWDDVMRAMREDGLDTYVEQLEEYSATSLRKKAGEADAIRRERDELVEKVNSLETLPKKQEALKRAGVVFDDLRPAELETIRTIKVEDVTDEWAEKFVEQYRLPVSTVDRETPEETGATKVAQAARSAPAGGGKKSGVITPDDLKEWTPDQRLEFRSKYPDAWEHLGEGGEVTGIAFPS